MDRDFEAYWNQNHKRLILNAPKKLRMIIWIPQK